MCLFPLGRIGGFKAPPTGPPSHLDRYRLGQCPRGSLPWIHGWQHSSLHGIRHSHPLWASGRTQCYRISFWHCKPVHNRMDLFNTITTKSISTKSSTWVRQCVFLPCERQNGWPMGFVSRSFSPDLNSPRVINSGKFRSFCELFHEKGAAYLNVVLSRSVLTPETLIWRICFRVHRPFLTQLCKISIIPRYLFALCPAVLHGCSAGQQVLTIEPHLQCFARSVTRTCLTCVIPSGDSSGWSVNFNKE